MHAKPCSWLIYSKFGFRNNILPGMQFRYLLLALVSMYIGNAFGQDTTRTVSPPANKQFTLVANIDFFTTFAAINVINGETSNEFNNLYLYYNFTLNNKLKVGKFAMVTYYFTEFGIRQFIDSIYSVSDDQYNFKNSVSYAIKNSGFAFNLCINSKSQYFNHYEYKDDSLGNAVKYLYTCYLSPAYSNFSAGLKYGFNDNCSIELGLVNGRNTKIRNQALFESRESKKLYGLDQGTSKKMEFGINMIFTIPTREILKNLYFENFSQVNVNKTDFSFLKDYKFDINNAFHYIFLKHFRLSLRTKCLYDININDKPKIINNFTIGFYLNNKF